jgi:tetratricopeptide (TPR) repeat protein
MQPTLKYLSAACASALLIACADVGQRTVPAAVAAQAAGSADDAYLVGRQQHMAGRRAPAAESYQAALRTEPRHLNARNGLATLYAEHGEYARAIALWQELTANPAEAGPASAYLYANLGYAYFLSADYGRARATLERACILDPLNPLAWRHLGDTLGKLDQDARAQLMYQQASALEAHDFKADYARARRAGVAPIDRAVAAEAAPDTMAQSEMRQGVDGMFELHRRAAPAAAPAVAPAPVVAAAAPPVASADDAEPAVAALQPARTFPVESAAQAEPGPAPDAAGTRLEIRNGNGVPGMARRLARKMADASLRVVRLSNQQGYNVARTRIEYLAGFRADAMRLAERFANASVEEVESCESAEIRLVLGRDLARSQLDARRIIKSALARAARAG